MNSSPARRLAIIIPCRNEERYIGRCLDSILSSDFDQRLLDVVVVDGMSTDGTRSIVAAYARRHAFIRLLDNPGGLKPTALNLGIANTDAEVVMRLDAHAEYDRHYIPVLVEGLFRYRADNIGGIRETAAGNSPWTKAIAHAVSHPFAAGNALYRTGLKQVHPRKVDTVFCGCYRREVFERIGLFNEKLIRTQDREFNQRLRSRGGKIVLDPGARCTYFPRSTLWEHCRWTFEGAAWLFSASRFTRTRMTSWRNWVPAAFVLWQAAMLAALALAPQLYLAASLPFAAYWALNALVSLSLAARERSLRIAPMLCLLFAATHYAYGLGSLAGWLTAKRRGRDLADCSYHRLREYRRAA